MRVSVCVYSDVSLNDGFTAINVTYIDTSPMYVNICCRFSPLFFFSLAHTPYISRLQLVYFHCLGKRIKLAQTSDASTSTIDKRRDIDINSAILEIDRLTIISTGCICS